MGRYISILYLGTMNNWIHSFLQEYYFWETETGEYFRAILEIHVLWANINTG